jgi:hypothetical protein
MRFVSVVRCAQCESDIVIRSAVDNPIQRRRLLEEQAWRYCLSSEAWLCENCRAKCDCDGCAQRITSV